MASRKLLVWIGMFVVILLGLASFTQGYSYHGVVMECTFDNASTDYCQNGTSGGNWYQNASARTAYTVSASHTTTACVHTGCYFTEDNTGVTMTNKEGDYVHKTMTFGMSYWIKQFSYAGSLNGFCVDNKQYSSNVGHEIAYLAASDSYQFKVRGAADGVLLSGSISDNNWHNIMVSSDGTKVYIQLDGGTITNVAAPGTSASASSYDLEFGDASNYFSQIKASFHIDDFVYFDYNLSPQNRTDLYNGGSGEVIDWSDTPPPPAVNVSYLNTRNATLTPLTAYTNDTLLGSCEGNSSGNLSFSYRWYEDYINIQEVNFIETSQCIQEQANQTSDCGGVNTGTYGFSYGQNDTNWHDANYNTYTRIRQNERFYINYSLPAFNLSAAKWSIKDGIVIRRNLTLPNFCINDPIRLHAHRSGITVKTDYYCYNISNSDWSFIGTTGTGNSNYDKIYEEAMVWIPQPFYNNNELINIAEISALNTTKGEDWIFSCQAVNSTDQSVWINSSTVTILNRGSNIDSMNPSSGVESNSLLNVTFTYNDIDGDAGTCGLYLDNILNVSKGSIAANTSTWLSPTNMSLGTTYFYVNCSDGTDITLSSNISYYYDPVNPVVNTNFINNTVVNFGDIIKADFNFSDNLILWTFNITINGALFNSTTNINTSTFNTTVNINTSVYGVGRHNLTVRAADGHTAKELKEEMQFKNGIFNDYSRYEWPSGGYVKTVREDKSILDDWESTKKKDRYTQIYKPKNPAKVISFIETSNKKIQIMDGGNLFKGQWIIIEDRWKDYVVGNHPESVVKIERIDDYSVKVTVSSDKVMNKLEFQSIGEINILTREYKFFSVNLSTTYPSQATELFYQTHLLTVNTSDDINTTTKFVYDNVEKNIVTTKYGSYDVHNATFIIDNIYNLTKNVSFRWNLTVNNNPANNYSVDNWHIINAAVLDVCNATLTTRAVEFQVKESSNNTLIPGSVSGSLTYYGDNASQTQSVDLTYASNKTHSLCMYPNYVTYTSDGTITATRTSNLKQKSVVFASRALDNSTETIAFNFNANEERVIFSVIDQDDNPVNNVVIIVQETNIVTNQKNITDTIRTGSNGVAITDLILYEQWYTFNLTLNNILILLEGPFKIVSTDNTIRVILVTDYESDFTKFKGGITYALSFDNTSNTFTLSYNNTIGETPEVCMEITEFGVSSDVVVNSTCYTASDGVIDLSIPGTPNDALYIAQAVAYIDDLTYVLDVEEANFDKTYMTYGTTGLFVSFLLILFLSLVGTWNAPVAVLLNTVGLIFARMLDLYYMSWVSLVCYVAIAGIVIYRLNKR